MFALDVRIERAIKTAVPRYLLFSMSLLSLFLSRMLNERIAAISLSSPSSSLFSVLFSLRFFHYEKMHCGASDCDCN